ncbi:MAG TPA: hypothetical protein VFH78_07860 [Candidatus Thermoplasmatota archaeon]|nr:hypothetical protein [Candidatus Thermoplasmatota archaeon]
MRLHRVPSAAAIILLVLAAQGPAALASTAPTATLVSPGDGATVGPEERVRIAYSGFSPLARNASGYLMLDGQPAGTFIVPIPNTTTGTITINATLAAGGFSSGAHALSARVFTDRDAPVDTQAITVLLDHPPKVSNLSWSYDLDARTLRVHAEIGDEGATLVHLSSGGNNTTATANGVVELALHAPRPVGNYTAVLGATDARNQTTRVSFLYEVADREADIVITSANVSDGRLRVAGTLADPDGLGWLYLESLPGSGSGPANASFLLDVPAYAYTGTWNATLHHKDPWNGHTAVHFTITIVNPRVTVFERTIDTSTGAYADRSNVTIPPLQRGVIEICIDGCGADDELSASRLVSSLLCPPSANETVPCRAVTGRPVAAGALELCRDSPPPNFPLRPLLGEPVWQARRAVETASPVGPCTSLLDTLASAERALPGAPQGVVVSLRQGSADVCTAAGGDRECSFATHGPTVLDLTWLQSPHHSVTVRITGERL